MIISGQTGEIISAHAPPGRQGRLMRGGQVARLRVDSMHSSAAIAVAARSPEGAAVLAIFDAAKAR